MLWDALDQQAKKNGVSLSQEVQSRLDYSIGFDQRRKNQLQLQALADAIMLVTHSIERVTGKHWLNDAFTAQAVRHAVETLMLHFAPHAAPAIPPRVDDAAKRMPPDAGERYRTPKGLGEMEAFALITQIENVPKPPGMEKDWKLPAGLNWPSELSVFWQLRRDLGSGWERNRIRIQSKEKRQ